MLRKDSIDFGFISHEVRLVCFLQPRRIPSNPKGICVLYRDTGPNTALPFSVLSWFLPHPMDRMGNRCRKEARLSVQRLKTQENSVLVNTYGETQS